MLKSYEYDTLGRFKKVIENDKLAGDAESVTTYSYDKVGNRISEVKNNKHEEYTYNNLNELLEVKDGNNIIKEYTYDANGNTKKEVTPEAEITYFYDISNQLTKYEMEDTENDGNTLTQKNEYNYTGQRTKKEVTSTKGEESKAYTNNYHYDRGNMLYTTDENDNKTTENILNFEGNVISSARFKSSDISFYNLNKDTRNSTTTLVDENSAGVTVCKYDEFGNTDILGEDTGNEVCYTGGINDKETGQLYLNARYYEPEDGRFVTLDTYRGSFEDSDTWHLYTYCVNNPINFVDPSGNFPQYPIYRSAIAKAGYVFLKRKGYDVAATMFGHSLVPKKYKLNKDFHKRAGRKMKKSNLMTNRLAIGLGKAIVKRQTKKRHKIKKLNWTSGDLFFAFAKADGTYTMKKKSRRRWVVSVKVKDKYDFDEFRNPTSLGGWANNVGRIMQYAKLLKPYWVTIKFKREFIVN